ncbi:recombinase family protein [Chenggangzhangella methanolivorans]
MIALLESVEKPWSDLVVTALTEEEKKRQFKRAVGYLRYSTRGQSPNSLVRQAELIRQYAAAHGMTVVAIVSDIATSGTLEKRPGLDEGLVMLADKHADVLIGEDCDRFARKHSIFPNLFDKVNDLGGQLWTVSKGHIADGTTANLYGAIAAEDRLRTVSRLSAGLRVSINHGRRIPYLGYGYDPGAEKGLWQINEEEAGHIRKMFDMAETGVSHHYIAIVMNQQGLRTRKGHPWRSTTIRKMLCNPIFSGVYLFGRKGYRTTAGARPTLVVEFEQLAIISAKQFAAVAWRLSQRARERKVKNAPRVQYTAHFLDRRVTCDACDRHMYAKTRQSGPAYRRSLECRGGDGLFIAGHGLEEGIVRGAVLDCIERRLLTDEASELFDAERAARRERERRALGKEKISLSLQLQSAEAKADASFEDGWMIGASEDRRIRKRIELEEKVTEIRDLINQLRLREKALLAADENRETLAERFTRFREEGSSLSSQAAFELAHALRSVLVGVRVSFDRENGAYDLRIELAPDGGADLMGAAPQETVVEYRRIYRRILRDSGDEFLTRVRAALEAGWLSLSRQDYLRLVEAAPVLTTLPKSWPVETRINFIRGVLACALTGLAATALDDLVEAEGRRSRSGGIHQLRGGFERLAASGGVEQLRDALLALDIAGLPRIEGELMPDRHKLPIMTWLPEWDAPEWRSHDGSHAFSNDQGDVAPFVCDAPGMQTPEPCDGDSEVDERDVWALAAAGDDD